MVGKGTPEMRSWRVESPSLPQAPGLAFDVLMLAEIHGEGSLLPHAGNGGAYLKLVPPALENFVLLAFDDLEPRFVTTPPGFLILALDARTRLQLLVEDHKSDGVEPIV